MVPFARLFPDLYNINFNDNILSTCAQNNIISLEDVTAQIVEYLQLFQGDPERVQNAFTAAAFLANEAWLVNLPSGAGETPGECSILLHYDPGADSQKPSITITGIVVFSVLLGIFLSCLFAMALYSFLSPRWTSQLDSFAMMRIGATIADEVPLKVVSHTTKVEVLDRTPGFIGDATEDPVDVGGIGLGCSGPLNGRKAYHSYRS